LPFGWKSGQQLFYSGTPIDLKTGIRTPYNPCNHLRNDKIQGFE
jgi:hypothetical protein